MEGAYQYIYRNNQNNIFQAAKNRNLTEEEEMAYFKETEIDKMFNLSTLKMVNHLINFSEIMHYFLQYGEDQMNDHLTEVENMTFSSLLGLEMANFNKDFKMYLDSFTERMFKKFSLKMINDESLARTHVITINETEEVIENQWNQNGNHQNAKSHYFNLTRAKETIKQQQRHKDYIKLTEKLNVESYTKLRRRFELFGSLHFSKFLADENLSKVYKEVLKFQNKGGLMPVQVQAVGKFSQVSETDLVENLDVELTDEEKILKREIQEKINQLDEMKKRRRQNRQGSSKFHI